MKRILFIIFIVISFVIIYNFSSSIYKLLSKKNVLIQAESELKKAQMQNGNLKNQLSHVKNPQFVEEQARDRLFLVKPGENTVVIPQNLLPIPISTKKLAITTPNWQKWVKLFIH